MSTLAGRSVTITKQNIQMMEKEEGRDMDTALQNLWDNIEGTNMPVTEIEGEKRKGQIEYSKK